MAERQVRCRGGADATAARRAGGRQTLAAQVPGLPHTKAKRTINPEAEALLAAISGYRTRAAASGRSTERVIAVYEAGELAIEFSKESCLWRFSGWLKRCKYSLIDKYVR